MSSLKQLTYRVWRILEGGDIPDDSRFRYKEIRDHVKSAVFSALKQNYFEQLNAGESRYGDDQLSKIYDATVEEDISTGLKYITLPGEGISVPASSRTTSIQDPNPFSVWATEYIPVRMEEAFTYKLQDDIPCVVLYTQTGNRIEFFNDEIETGKKLKVVRKYTVTDNDDEELNLPGEYELQIVDSVTRLLDREIRLNDRQNDGVPNQVNRV
jgi:hypothetical protein